MHPFRFPAETDEYRRARNELLRAELELRRRTEEVAAMRRELPVGGAVPQDYPFVAIDGGTVRLSELFGGKDTLVLYNFMYGPDAAKSCPMCTSFLDGLNGNAVHIEQRVALAVVAKSPAPRIREFAQSRGWRLRMLSSGATSFNRDYHGETADGDQNPMLHVFVKKGGAVHHFWASEVQMVPPQPGQNERHLDPMWPLWNVLDLTPAGRGAEFYPQLAY